MSPFNVDVCVSPVWGMWTVRLGTTPVDVFVDKRESSARRRWHDQGGRCPSVASSPCPAQQTDSKKRAAATEAWLQPLPINGKFVSAFLTTVPMAKCSLGALV